MADLPGAHQRKTYVALVYGLLRARRTGVLEVRSGRSWRRFYFVSGHAVWYSSDKAEEELSRTLVKAGLVTAGQMKSHTSKQSPFEPISERLLAAGLIGAQDLEDHRTGQLGPAVAAPLAWPTGEWSFQSRDALRLESIDPALFPDANALEGLWAGVRTYVQMEEAVQGLSATPGGVLVPSDELRPALESLSLEGPLAGLAATIGDGQTVEELFRQIPDRSGSLMQMLWLLSSCGLLVDRATPADVLQTLLCGGRELVRAAQLQLGLLRVKEAKAASSALRSGLRPSKAGPGKAKLVDRKKAPVRKEEALPLEAPGRDAAAAAAPGAPPPAPQAERDPHVEHLSKLISTAHGHRMGKDYYAFFDLDRSAHADDVHSAFQRLSRGWNAAATDPRLDQDDYARVQELLHAAKLVWQTLSNPERRKDYDVRVREGTQPHIVSQLAIFMASERALRHQQDLRSGAAEPAIGHAHSEARALMKRGEYARALPHLKQQRGSSGSDPGVLADLGWCFWKVHGATIPGDGDDDGAEDLLLLAQTFDPSHAKAMEYLARMARERGDNERTLLWTGRLLKVHPRSTWGLKMLAELEDQGLSLERGPASGGAAKRGR